MQSLIIVAVLVAVAAAQFANPPVPLIERTEIHDDAGQFSLRYQTGDGITFAEQGVLKRNPAGTDNVLVKHGSYSYTSPDGTPVRVEYVADENGFQPKGSPLPQPVVAGPPTF